MNRGAIPRRFRRFHILHPAPQGGILKGYPAVLPRGGSLFTRFYFYQFYILYQFLITDKPETPAEFETDLFKISTLEISVFIKKSYTDIIF
jgi:hypothetical protein